MRGVMKKQDFYFELPQGLIAQDPLKDRSASRLLVLDKKTGEYRHRGFKDIVEYLRAGDCLVINDTKVIPARLIGTRVPAGTKSGAAVQVRTGSSAVPPETSDVGSGAVPPETGDSGSRQEAETTVGASGAQIELLLLKRREKDVWETLVRPGKKAKPGTKISFGGGLLTAEVLDIVEEGNRLVKFSYQGIFEEILDSLGQMPLPPYITHRLADKNRYQTVYAKYEGSAAAPTAGLHFTQELLSQIEAMGVTIAHVTLHVGLGTFRPVKEENILDHHMHSEFYRVLPQEAEKINAAKRAGGRIFCVGTTSCRTVESAAGEDGMVRAGEGDTEIFIYPGYRFKALDCLITNFHLPESTLLMLVSALAGREQVLAAYEEAVREEYRFFSFGDAMLII